MSKDSITERSEPSSSVKYFLFIAIFISLTDFAIFLNIPILRQIFGFVFLTFIPGFLLTYILKMNKLGLIEKFVVSVGLSISFTMFGGLLINTIYPYFGYQTPLTTISLLIFFTVAALVLAVFAYLRNRAAFIFPLIFELNIREKTYLILPTIFPLLGISGMWFMNNTDNNLVLMVFLFIIPAYILVIAIKHNQISNRIFPLIIFLVGISVILLMGLRSNYIIGVDIHTEYYLFQRTFESGHWQPLQIDPTLDSCLSISILPTVYQSFMDINSQYLFKLLYPMLFSVSPLVVYLISKQYLNNLYSFLSSFYFISQYYFLNAEYSPRTVIAILFFGLLFMTAFLRNLNDFQKSLLFVVFTASCIVSHYSTTYIFFIILVLMWVLEKLIYWILLFRRKLGPVELNLNDNNENTNTPSLSKGIQLKTHLNLKAIFIVLVMLFFWYAQITWGSFEAGVSFIRGTINSFQVFFNMENRGGSSAVLGYELGSKSIPQKLDFVFSWMTVIFIAIGELILLVRYRRRIGTFDKAEKFILQKFDTEFLAISIALTSILVLAVVLPFVSIGYDMDRTTCQVMIILSPVFIIGAFLVSKLFRFKLAYIMILIVLIPYFTLVSGATYQLFGDSRAIILNSKGQNYELKYVHYSDSLAAKWLNAYAPKEANYYSDYYGYRKLISQGEIGLATYDSSLVDDNKAWDNGYFYLDYNAVVGGKLLDQNINWHSVQDYGEQFQLKNLIYSSSAAEVYK